MKHDSTKEQTAVATIHFPVELWREVKRDAIDRGTSATALVVEATRQFLGKPKTKGAAK